MVTATFVTYKHYGDNRGFVFMTACIGNLFGPQPLSACAERGAEKTESETFSVDPCARITINMLVEKDFSTCKVVFISVGL